MAPLGNLVRLVPLELDILPSHPALETTVKSRQPQRIERSPNADENVSSKGPQKATQGASSFEPSIMNVNGRPNLRPFVMEILDQAVAFMDDTLPATFKLGSEKSSSPSSAKVRLLNREITGKQISEITWQNSKIPRDVPQGVSKLTETWFARRSRHVNRKGTGSADFLEFDRSLRVKHSEHEGKYTPDVFDVHNVLEWAVHDESVPEEDDSVAEEARVSRYTNITMGSRYSNIWSLNHR